MNKREFIITPPDANGNYSSTEEKFTVYGTRFARKA
jgi:hypothetical protein